MAIPEGRGSIFVFRNWKFRGGGGTCVKFPPSWRYGYFLELHIITNNKIEKTAQPAKSSAVQGEQQ